MFFSSLPYPPPRSLTPSRIPGTLPRAVLRTAEMQLPSFGRQLGPPPPVAGAAILETWADL